MTTTRYYVILDPLARTPAGALYAVPATRSGPFESRARAESTAQGALATGQFVAARVIARQEEVEADDEA